MNADQILICRLLHTSQIGPATFWQLWDQLKNLQDMVHWLTDHKHQVPTSEWAQQHIRNHEKQGVQVCHFLDPAFPVLLRHIISCPPILYCKGQMALLDRPMVGIVGARGASAPMVHFVKRLAQDLGKAGFVVVSGLAAGIDTAAHMGALETGTVGICAGGVDQIYPQQNVQLYKDVGLLISEMPWGTKPTSYLFPKRNRIIAGLSAGVVVVEASFQSGSLITGQCAAEFNRDVFVVPGSPLDPRSRGGNKLIKDGAHLAESAEDILRVLRYKGIRHPREELCSESRIHKSGTMDPRLRKDDSASGSSILPHLSHIPISLDTLHQQSNIPMDMLHKELARLEIQGLITRDPNGFLVLK